jgi:dCMP deaminase
VAVASRGTRRASFDEYALQLARTAATRGTCVRRRQGAVLVQGRRIVATGYDGGPSGYPHCDEGGCPRSAPGGTELDDSRCIAVHAAANVLLFSSPEEREGASLYTTGVPCFGCAKLIANAGVSEVVAAGGRYEGSDEVRDFLRTCGVRVRVLDGLEGVPSLRFT